jgi:hypothetical protein
MHFFVVLDFKFATNYVSTVPHSAAPSHYNPWSNITDTETSHQPSPGPEIHAPLDIELFTDDSIPLPGSPAMQRTVSQKSNACLSEEQEHILDLVQRGRNIFFTGSAGELSCMPGSGYVRPCTNFTQRNREVRPPPGDHRSLWR